MTRISSETALIASVGLTLLSFGVSYTLEGTVARIAAASSGVFFTVGIYFFVASLREALYE